MSDDALPVKESGWTAWIPMQRKHSHECCDCSLTHFVEQRVLPDGTIEERWKRDNRATANRRR